MFKTFILLFLFCGFVNAQDYKSDISVVQYSASFVKDNELNLKKFNDHNTHYFYIETDKKLFENILDNLKKPISPVRSQYANGGKVASASDDPLYKEYIKEIELGNLSPDIPFDKWRDQYDEILLEGPLSKKYDEIETMILNNALAKIDEAINLIGSFLSIFSAISFAQDCTKIVVQKHGVSTI